MKVKLSQGEINSFGEDIAKVLSNVPLYYLNEVMEYAMEDRIRDGDHSDLDISSEEEEKESSSEEEEEPKTTSDEETSTDGDDGDESP